MQTTEVHEVGFREVIVTVQGYLKAAVRKWYLILLTGLLTGGYFYYTAASQPVRYVANINFLVSEEPGGGNIGLGSILGGIGLGGGASGGGQNLERVLAFSRSMRLINHVLLDSVEIEGVRDLMANHIIQYEGLVEAWDMMGAYGKTRLAHDSIPLLDKQERSILKGVYNYCNFSEAPLLDREIGEGTGIIEITAVTQNEELSYALCNAVFAKLSEFYSTESAGQSRASVQRLEHRSDSLLQELTRAEYELAGLYDTRLNINSQRSQVRQAQLSRKVGMLAVAHGQVTANLETAKFALGGQTPFFQIMDVPYLPLNRKKKYPIPQGLLGVSIGIFLGLVGVSVHRFFTTVMAPDA